MKNNNLKKDYPLIQKAYRINFDKIEEGFLFSERFCHADNVNKAKSKLLLELNYEDTKLRFSDESVCYTNIPVERYPQMDMYLFEEKEMTLNAIERLLLDRERIANLDAILNDPNVCFCYIKKRGIYYRPNSSGYTERIFDAGIYSTYDAVRKAKSCDELTIIPINIEEHNAMIYDKIKDLELKLI